VQQQHNEELRALVQKQHDQELSARVQQQHNATQQHNASTQDCKVIHASSHGLPAVASSGPTLSAGVVSPILTHHLPTDVFTQQAPSHSESVSTRLTQVRPFESSIQTSPPTVRGRRKWRVLAHGRGVESGIFAGRAQGAVGAATTNATAAATAADPDAGKIKCLPACV